jgi:hypothetical protein
MTEAVTEPVPGTPEAQPSDKELNFRKLEASRDTEREARIRAELQTQQMREELQNIKEMLKPKEDDPLDGIEDYVDSTRLKAKLDKERAAYEKQAKAIARQTYEQIQKEERDKNFLGRLKSEHSDYDQVMNENSIAALEKQNPHFVQAILKIGDEYERRKLAYDYLKANQAAKTAEPAPSIKEKVAENASNPYYVATGSGTPMAVEFDVKSASARKAAYEKLKAAQKRPIGAGTGPSH